MKKQVLTQEKRIAKIKKAQEKILGAAELIEEATDTQTYIADHHPIQDPFCKILCDIKNKSYKELKGLYFKP